MVKVSSEINSLKLQTVVLQSGQTDLWRNYRKIVSPYCFILAGYVILRKFQSKINIKLFIKQFIVNFLCYFFLKTNLVFLKICIFTHYEI